MAKKIRPLHNRLIVKRIEEDEKTAGGIIIPDTAQEKPMQGEIVAVGPGARSEDGKVTTLDVQAGDRILFASDGLSEAMDADGNYFGCAPIEAAVGDRTADCTAVVERLRGALHRHCGGRSTTDDVTILCVDRL